MFVQCVPSLQDTVYQKDKANKHTFWLSRIAFMVLKYSIFSTSLTIHIYNKCKMTIMIYILIRIMIHIQLLLRNTRDRKHHLPVTVMVCHRNKINRKLIKINYKVNYLRVYSLCVNVSITLQCKTVNSEFWYNTGI